MSNIALLPERGVLRIAGDDRVTFLQGLITNDIRKAEQAAIFAALLSPQGKFLHDFFIVSNGDGFLFDTARERIPDLIKRLSMYKLRAKVILEDVSAQYQVAAIWGEGKNEMPLSFRDPRHTALGARVIARTENKITATADADAYDRHRLSLAIPDGVKDLVFDRSILLENGYDELNAVDFTKGCYVGQEVTARTKHRAAIRKFIHQVTGDVLPASGTPIMLGAREVGEMRSSNGKLGLAMLRVDEVEKARTGADKLTGADEILEAKLPGWAKTQFAA